MIKRYFKPKASLTWINYWPTFFIQGIKVKKLDSQITKLKVTLKKRFLNLNYVGTHFGGTLYSMTDPWFMLILMHHLGDEYIVWDKSSHINFIRPGVGTITGIFEIDLESISRIKTEVDKNINHLESFKVILRDENAKRVARVEKTVFIKRL